MSRCFDAILKNYQKSILLGVLVCTILAIGTINLHFDYSYKTYFREDDQQLVEFETIQDQFSETDNVIFALEPKSGDVFTKEFLTALHWLTEESWQLPYSTKVSSISNYQHTYVEGDDLLIRALVEEPESLANSQIAQIKDIALSSKSIENRLVSRDGDMALVNIIFSLPYKSPWETPKIAHEAEQIKAAFEAKFPNIKLHAAGFTLLNNAFVAISQADMNILMPLMILIMAGLMFWLLGSWKGVLGTLLITTLSIGATIGAFSWFKFGLNGTSVSAPLIILTLAVANSIHLLVTFQQKMTEGMNKDSALKESLRLNFWPIIITASTTAIGFFSLNLCDSPPFADLGNISAVGIIIAATLSLTVLPAFVTAVDYQYKVQEKHWIPVALDKISTTVIQRSVIVLLVMSVSFTFITAFSQKNQVNDMFKLLFSEKLEFRQALEFVDANVGGVNTMEIAMTHEDDKPVTDPQFLRDIEAVTSWLESKSQIDHVDSISHLVKRIGKNLNQNNEAFYSIPDNPELAAQYILLYELSLPAGHNMNDLLNLDKTATRINLSFSSLDSIKTLELEQEIKTHLAIAYPNYDFKLSGISLMFSHIGIKNTKSMVEAGFLALVGISVILLLALRSIKLGILSLVPNLIPALLAFGVWGMFNGEFGIAISCALGMSLGIVVDDTVHFLARYKMYREQYDAPAAIQKTFSSVGHALFITTVVLACGFSVLALSAFQVNADVGIFNAITIIFALICDFLLLPAVLLLVDRKKQDQSNLTSIQAGEQPSQSS